MVSKEGYNALAIINKVQEREIQKLRAENRDLKKKLELLKDFEFLRMIFK